MDDMGSSSSASVDTGSSTSYDSGSSSTSYDSGSSSTSYDSGSSYSSHDSGSSWSAPSHDSGSSFSSHDPGSSYSTHQDTSSQYSPPAATYSEPAASHHSVPSSEVYTSSHAAAVSESNHQAVNQHHTASQHCDTSEQKEACHKEAEANNDASLELLQSFIALNMLSGQPSEARAADTAEQQTSKDAAPVTKTTAQTAQTQPAQAPAPAATPAAKVNVCPSYDVDIKVQECQNAVKELNAKIKTEFDSYEQGAINFRQVEKYAIEHSKQLASLINFVEDVKRVVIDPSTNKLKKEFLQLGDFEANAYRDYYKNDLNAKKAKMNLKNNFDMCTLSRVKNYITDTNWNLGLFQKSGEVTKADGSKVAVSRKAASIWEIANQSKDPADAFQKIHEVTDIASDQCRLTSGSRERMEHYKTIARMAR